MNGGVSPGERPENRRRGVRGTGRCGDVADPEPARAPTADIQINPAPPGPASPQPGFTPPRATPAPPSPEDRETGADHARATAIQHARSVEVAEGRWARGRARGARCRLAPATNARCHDPASPDLAITSPSPPSIDHRFPTTTVGLARTPAAGGCARRRRRASSQKWLFPCSRRPRGQADDRDLARLGPADGARSGEHPQTTVLLRYCHATPETSS